MDAKRLKYYEAVLLRERDRCLAALHRLESEEAEPQSVSAGDTVRGSKTMADAASDTLEQETDFSSASRLSTQLAELDAALDLILKAPVLFGSCRECGDDIDAERLELVPWAPECGTCARRMERTGAR